MRLREYAVMSAPVEIDGVLRQPGETVRVNILDPAIDRLIGLRLQPPRPPSPAPPTRPDGLYVVARASLGGPEPGTVLHLTGAQADRRGDYVYRLDLHALLAIEPTNEDTEA